jgi:hypothetical protein
VHIGSRRLLPDFLTYVWNKKHVPGFLFRDVSCLLSSCARALACVYAHIDAKAAVCVIRLQMIHCSVSSSVSSRCSVSSHMRMYICACACAFADLHHDDGVDELIHVRGNAEDDSPPIPEKCVAMCSQLEDVFVTTVSEWHH